MFSGIMQWKDWDSTLKVPKAKKNQNNILWLINLLADMLGQFGFIHSLEWNLYATVHPSHRQ